MPTSSGDAIADAWREFEGTVARARTALDAVRARPVHTPEMRRRLHEDALAGALGLDMRRLAEHVEAGRTTWGEAFEGYSPYSALLSEHLGRMVEDHAETVRDTLAEDPDFDPWAPDPTV